jgi:NAD binding domain of 6-phosphogluconate dehydrogenase
MMTLRPCGLSCNFVNSTTVPAFDRNLPFASDANRHPNRTFEFSAETCLSKVGFIGLGIMGKPMSLQLAKGGHELFTYATRRSRSAAFHRICLNHRAADWL